MIKTSQEDAGNAMDMAQDIKTFAESGPTSVLNLINLMNTMIAKLAPDCA